MSRNFIIDRKKCYLMSSNPILDNKIDKIDTLEHIYISKNSKEEFYLDDLQLKIDPANNTVNVGNETYKDNVKVWDSEDGFKYIDFEKQYVLSETNLAIPESPTISIFNNTILKDGNNYYENGTLLSNWEIPTGNKIYKYDHTDVKEKEFNGIWYKFERLENQVIVTVRTTIYRYQISNPSYAYYSNLFEFEINFSYFIVDSNSISIGNGTNNFSMNSNFYMSIRTKIGSTLGQNVTYYNANDIISKYKNGKRTINIEMPLIKLYNESGNIVINPEKGGVIKIGDTFKVQNSNNINSDILFVVTSFELSNNGIIKIKITGKEVV